MKQSITDAVPAEKKGLLRLLELMDRDLSKFFKAGLLAFAGLLPMIFCTAAAVAFRSPIFLTGNILCGMIAFPELSATADTVMRSIRDDSTWWWDHYRAAWKRELRHSLLPGALLGLFSSVEVYLLYSIAGMENPFSELWLFLASVLISSAITGTFLPMLVCMDLPFTALVKNCFFLFFSHPVRALAAALVRLIYIGLMLMWFPLTAVLFLLSSVWLPMLLSDLILWPVLNAHFGLKDAYQKLKDEKLARE